MSRKPRVLVAPLDWGLGHSTRCIPIIKELKRQGCEVFIAADKRPFFLLKKEFPDTVFLRYKGYEIAYSRQKSLFAVKLVFQFPKIVLRIFLEKKWLGKVIEKYQIDVVISDNRFGMHTRKIPCVYITHQLCIKTGTRLFDEIAQKLHYYFIRKYTICWVPDCGKNGLAGELSHPHRLPENVKYIGPLSRFKKNTGAEKIYDLLIIISGPEPQRTIFENQILHQLKTVDLQVFVVRGLPGQKDMPENFGKVIIKNHLSARELNETLQQSKWVLCRSGYTSIMDLSVLEKKAILIPTPGQTEQEYLAKYLMEKGYFFSVEQKNFSLARTLQQAGNFNFIAPAINPNEFEKTVDELVHSLKADKK